MVRSSRAVGVSWDMGVAQGLRVGVWEGSEMVYCTIGSSHLKAHISTGASVRYDAGRMNKKGGYNAIRRQKLL